MNTQPSQQQTTQQKRAAFAYPQVQGVLKIGEKTAKEYKSLVRGFPATVQIDGLGAALAFLIAKASGDKNSPHGLLYAHLEAWLSSPSQNHTSTPLLQSVISLDSTRYRQVTVEVQAYLVWLKRFAEAEIKDGTKDKP
jgi:CRISPR-associated protein Cmr5